MRIRNLIQTAPLVIRHSWWSARKWLACSSSPEREKRSLNLSSLEDRVLFDAMPLASVVTETETIAVDELSTGTNGAQHSSSAAGGRDGITITDLAGVTTAKLGQGNARTSLLDWDSLTTGSLTGLNGDNSTSWATAETEGSQVQRLELVFVDSGIDHVDELLKDLERPDSSRHMEVIVLDAATDGVLQVTDALRNYSNVDAVHIISHGTAGGVRLGSSWLMASRLENYAAALTTWGTSLSDGADILIYGCDLAGSAEGRTLLSSLNLLTGADIAASIDDTGHTDLGGDWELEYVIGSVESTLAVSVERQQQWQGLLSNVVFQQGTNSYAGTQDTHIEESAANRENGGNPKVWLHESPLSIGLLRFDQIFGDGPGQIPLGSTIHSASLSIDVAFTGSTGSTLALNRMLIDWNEGQTWNSGGWSVNGAGVQFDDTEASASIDAYLSSTTERGLQTFSGTGVTQTVQQWANGAANFGWALKYAGPGAMTFNSSESSGAAIQPMLTINYTAPRVELRSTDEQRVNVTTTNSQLTNNSDRGSRDAVTILPNGDSVFVWSSQNQDGSGWGVYTQRYSKNGLAITSENRVNGTTTGDQRYASVASDSNGNYVVTWTSSGQDGSGQGVYARVYYADGTTSNEFLVNQTTAGDQFNSAVDMDDVGHIIFAWEGNGTQSGHVDGNGVFMRRFNLNTTSMGGEVRVNTITANGQNQVSVAAAPDGRFVVMWDDSIGVSGRRFAANGTARDASQFVVHSEYTAGEADVAMDDAGNFTVVWRTTNQGDGSQRAVMMSRYADSGALLQGPTVVSDVSANLQTNPSIAMKGTGEFLVVWEGAGPGDTDGVFVRKFAANGTPMSAEVRVNATVSGTQSMASVAMIDTGNFTVVWSGNGTGDTSGVFLRQFGTLGIPAASLLLSTTGNVTNSGGVPGLASWTTGSILRFGDPGFQLGETTAGVLQQFGNVDNLPNDGSTNIDALHYVTRQITLSNGIVLLPGDVLYSSDDFEFYPGPLLPLSIPKQSILRFRPSTTGDYSVGTTEIVYYNLGLSFDPLLAGLSDINGISLIERDTVVAGTTLVKGDMLFTRSADSGGYGNDIFVYHAATNTASRLVEGSNIGITGGIGDIELIESTIIVGGQTLNTGTILLTLVTNETSIGTNGLAATANDVIALQLSQNSMTGSPTIAIASMVLDGSDVALDSNAERLNALSLMSLNQEPVAANDAYTVIAGRTFDSAVDAWYDRSWGARQKISFDNSTRNENLANFPVLISLDASRIDYSRVHGAGDDLRFVDRDGTELAYEIESWNPNGRSSIWVKVPQIDANSANDFIWMYYDNGDGVAAGANAAGVWSNSFDAVYHFNDSATPGGVVTDSTGRGIHGTNVGTTAANGVVGSARSFNGVNQYIDLGDNLALIQGANAVTLSAWVQTSTTNNNQRIVAISANGAPNTTNSRASMQIDGTEVRSSARANDSEANTSTITTGAGVGALEWKQVSIVINYASDRISTYVNGLLVSTSNVSFVGTSTSLTAATNAALGADDNGTSPIFAGLMDEVRIASAARSAAWLSAEYAASTDMLAKYGSIQTVAGVLENDVDPEGFSLTATSLDTTGTQGTVFLNPDGSFTYDDGGLFAGMIAGESTSTQFRYTAIDSEGSPSTATVTLTILGVNDAPVLDSAATMTLSPINETNTNSAGNTVASILATGGDPITDVDAGAVEGIAVYHVIDMGGHWEYSTNSGASWTAFGAVTEDSAVLLSSTARMRFVPNGTHAAHDSFFLFRAWDQTDGKLNGATGVNIRTNGGNTAYSAETASATILVNHQNLAPIAVADSYTVMEDTTFNTHPGDWFDVSWQARRRLTFDNSAATETLTNFPILVKLDSSRIDYSIMKGNGTDLRFVDSSGNLLAYEIDEWNPSGVSSVWVKIPTIAAGSTNGFVWMYYGNNGAANGENAAGVWSNGYEAVYHLEEDPISSGGRFSDSTGRLPEATNVGTANAAGIIGQSQQFNTGTAINLGGSLPLLQGVPATTLSAWIKPDTVTGNSVVLGIADNDPFFPDLSKASIEIVDGKLQIIGMDSNDSVMSFALVQTSSNVLTVGKWQLVTAVLNYSTGTIDVYVDGESVGHFDNKFDRPTSDNALVNRAAMGAEDGRTGSHFDGLIDEVQISRVARSSSWIKAQYASMTNQFVSFSSELNQAGVLDNDIDSDGGHFEAFLVTGPSFAQSFTFNGSGSFTYTPLSDFSGADSFTYYVSDGVENSTAVTVTINVVATNDAPTISTIPNQTISEDGTTGPLSFTIGDIDTPTSGLIVTASSSNGTIIPNGNIVLAGTGTNRTITVTPSPDRNGGPVTIQVTVSDGLLSTHSFFDVTITPVDDPFTVTKNTGISVGKGSSIQISKSNLRVSDIDTSPTDLVYSVISNTGGGFLAFSGAPGTAITSFTQRDINNGLLRYVHSGSTNPTETIGLSVTDGTTSLNLTLSVIVNNGRPIANPGGPYTVNERAQVTLNGGGSSDSDGNIVRYEWDLNYDGVTFQVDATGVTPLFDASLLNSPTTRTIALRVVDDSGAISTVATTDVTVLNVPPTTSGISNILVLEDAPPIVIDLNAAFVNPDTGSIAGLTFTATESRIPGLLASTSVDPTSGTLTLSLKANANGHSNITVRGTDAQGAFVETTFQLTVIPVNDKPVVSNLSYTANHQGSVTRVHPGVLIGASDVDGDLLTAILITGPEHGTLLLQADGSFVYQAEAGFTGQDSFTFVASDSQLTSSTGVVTITVPRAVGGVSPSNGSTSSSGSGESIHSNGNSAPIVKSDSSTTTVGNPVAQGGSGSGTRTDVTTEQQPKHLQVDEENLIGFGLLEQNNDDSLLGLLTRKQQEDLFSNRDSAGLSGSDFHATVGSERPGDAHANQLSHGLINSQLWMNDYRDTLQFVGKPGRIWDDLDSFQKQVNATFGMETVVIGSAATAAGSMTVGYVLWTLRSGVLLSSLLAQMPAWRLMDPLTILENMNLNDDEDEESLASLVDQEEADPANEPEPRSDK